MSTTKSPSQPSTLSADQLELLSYFLAEENSPYTQASLIVPRVRTQPVPLSFAQRRLWFLDQYEPNNSFYNVTSASRMLGSLKLDALQQTLNAIVARHETLRTTFSLVRGESVQVIAETRDQALQVFDLKPLSDNLREAEAKRLAEVESRRPFDLSKGPLLRVSLIQLGAEDHILVITMHHIISDGWSIGILWRELASLYGSFVQGSEANLPTLPIQYADFALWQKEWLQGKTLEEQLAYWKQRMAGATPLLELPVDRPRPSVQSHHGQQKRFVLSRELTAELDRLSQREGVTLFMTLLAAFKLLLAKYSLQDDIVVGSPIANRNRMEIEDLIGFFVNTLVLRTDLSGNPSFCELLRRVKDTCLQAYANQEFPFERLVEELNPPRVLGTSPLFQVMFSLQNAPEHVSGLPEIQTTPLCLDTDTAKFDLSLGLNEASDGLTGVFEHNSDLFDATTITRMLGHYKTLLEGIVAEPDQNIATLPLLTPQERHQLLIEWNDTEADYPADKSIHQLVEEQAERTPDAVAVVYANRGLTYRDLNAKANQLAHYLKKLGVAPDVLVGICVERSLEMILGLLGILKAGGAYVPLDPGYPRDRLKFMLEDSGASLLLTQQRLVESLPTHNSKVFCLDTDWEEVIRESEENLSVQTTADNLAYVIYTSGSTGNPKGVEISHKALCNHMHWMQARFPLTIRDRVLQKTPFSFDASVWEFFAPLSLGSQLILAKPGGHQDVGYLIELITEKQVTILQLVPSLLRLLLRAPALENCRSLRRVFCGGELLSSELQRRFFVRLGVELCNLYGPTEACIDATFHTSKELETYSTVPIGRPIGNTQVYILDQQRNPVPVGVTGELYIGGDGLARGYLNRPELTAEKFIANPFSTQPHARLYKTGDLARYLADGNIEFLGRIDDQVKIRGFRIELGEIGSVLDQHPAVREAVVLAGEDSSGEKRLIAYVVANQQPSPATNQLRSYLKEKLPDYMVPSAFVFLDKLPLTSNGKVDRKALPAPDQSRPELEESYVTPRTPVEEVVASIWSEVLNLENVGIHDNFFDLGGHSLVAARVVSRIMVIFQIELPLRTLFEMPTVANLSEHIEAIRWAGDKTPPIAPACRAAPTEPRLRCAARNRDLPLSFAQQRLWFLDQLEPGSTVYNVPVALRVKGPLDVGILKQSLEEIVRRHEVLRTTFLIVDGQPVQVIAPSPSSSLRVLDISHFSESEREEEAQRLATEETQKPFNLEHGPLFRAAVIRLREDDHVLVLTLHHIVSDAWSMGVLYRELSVLYPAFANSRPSPLPVLPIQYIDFATWQRDWLQGEVLETQLSYWKKQLEGIPLVLNLPTDRPRPTIQSFRGASQYVELPNDLTQGLKSLSRKEGVTLYMTLLAAFQTLLHRYTGQDDIVVGSPIANRNRVEIEGLIGFFVNTLVLRTVFSGNPSFCELLPQVRELALDAYAHQDLPFQKLVEELQPERSLSHSPLFQAMFVFQNAPSTALSFEGLSVSPVRISGKTAKFDLTLTLHQESQGLRGSLQYNTDLFDDETIKRVLGHFQTLLAGIVADPGQNIATLPLLTPQERHQLLIEWNDTEADYPADKSIHQLVEEQAERTPDAVGVVYENRGLTYRDLNAKANQLARYLKKLGVGPDVLVGICVERSLEMIVGLLGILKAGGAYVPLDPKYPRERIAFMLEDAQIEVLLTQEKVAISGPSGRKINAVCLDRDWNTISKEDSHNLPRAARLDHLAYVIYTSGSTGQPKGVAIEHRNTVAFLYWAKSVFTSDELAGVLASTSICFDLSVFELFVTLSWGGKVILVEDALALNQTASLSGVTLVNTVPSALSELLANDGLPRSVRTVNLAGEPLAPELVRRIYQGGAVEKVYDLYGPSETTTYSTFALRTDKGRATIGRPIANTRIYILDAALAPVPIGVPGELYIGGSGVARGYWCRPELTAERYLRDPFAGKSGARMYRTGDLARYLADGNIEYLGRVDNQVKLRGFRIEPGEVNAALNACPGVKVSHVLARRQKTGELGLTAYYVENPMAATPPTAADLRRFLAQRLPNYMVPVSYISVPTIPLTPNGKVDPKALPDPQNQEVQNHYKYVAPRDEMETILCKLWGEILKLDRVGIDDDFFAIGGHSLLAAKLFSRLDEHFGRSLPLGVLFASPTVRALADLYRASTGQKTRALVALRKAGSLPPVFAVPGVFGNVVGFAELCHELGPGKPFYGLQSVGLDGSEPPLSSIEEMAVLYINEIRTVQPRGPYILLGACFGATVAYEMAHQLLAQGEEVAFLGLLDPTPRGGNYWHERPSLIPRAFRRAVALGSLALGRLHLYAEEIRRIPAKDRLKYFMQKFHILSRLGKKTQGLNGARRELNQIEVYHTNLAALDHYRRLPLDGALTAVEIFHTTRLGRRKERDPVNWNTFWNGTIVQHGVPGKNSGDMLTGGNAKILATLLAQRLSESLGATSASPVARQTNHTSGTERP